MIRYLLLCTLIGCSVAIAQADPEPTPGTRAALVASATCQERADAGPWAFFPLPGQDASTLKSRALVAYVDESDAKPPLGVPVRQATVRGYHEGKGVIVQCTAAGQTVELWGLP